MFRASIYGTTFVSQILYGPFPCFSVKGETDPVAGLKPLSLKEVGF